jgi:SPP1 family predicted phage head-tail adaptor
MIAKIAQLDRKIYIKQPQVVEDDAGQLTRTYTTWRTCYAMIRETYGSEQAQDQTITAQTTVEFTVRYKSGITHEMIIDYNGQTFNIKAITEAQYKGHFHRDRFQKITAVKTDLNTTHQHG